jgi:hypothetical protein
MVKAGPGADHQDAEADHRHGDPTVKAARLGVGPRGRGPGHPPTVA